MGRRLLRHHVQDTEYGGVLLVECRDKEVYGRYTDGSLVECRDLCRALGILAKGLGTGGGKNAYPFATKRVVYFSSESPVVET